MAAYANNISGNVSGTGSNEKKPSGVGSDLADKASEYATRAGEQIESMVDGAENTVRNVAAQGRVAGEQMQEVAGNMKTAIDKSVKEQPMATLAVAAVFGFVVGALWKS